MRISGFPLALLVVGLLVGCASTPRPTYRDFRPAPGATPPAADALRAAAEAAGWTVVRADSGEVSTDVRKVDQGILSATYASVDLMRLAGGAVRVLVQGERRSVFGSRSKVYALGGELRRTVLAPLTEALRTRGLVPLDAPRQRDEDATE